MKITNIHETVDDGRFHIAFNGDVTIAEISRPTEKDNILKDSIGAETEEGGLSVRTGIGDGEYSYAIVDMGDISIEESWDYVTNCEKDGEIDLVAYSDHEGKMEILYAILPLNWKLIYDKWGYVSRRYLKIICSAK